MVQIHGLANLGKRSSDGKRTLPLPRLMRKDLVVARAVEIPAESRVLQACRTVNLAGRVRDRIATKRPEGRDRIGAVHLLEPATCWIRLLMRLRDVLVRGFGLKTAAALRKSEAGRIGIFKVYTSHEHEIILGEDDKHLDFRVSVLQRDRSAEREGTPCVVVSTVVHCNNRLGRIYIRVIKPFHRCVVKALLHEAALRGWPA